MRDFYCLHEGYYEGVELRLKQLEEASKKASVNFICLNSLQVDYSKLPVLKHGDLLYNVSRGSEVLQTQLIHSGVKTFFKENPQIVWQTQDTTPYSQIHDKLGLKGPKTIYQGTNDSELLESYVDYLGGFPLVIKVKATSRGIGTIKVDSRASLKSVIDYLNSIGESFILREFIKAKSGARLMVVGDEVIASAEFAMNTNDFRNAAVAEEVSYTARKYSKAVEQLALDSTHKVGLEFAGVDFLEDEEGHFHLLEINFPTGFSNLIDLCAVDIPFLMIEHLKNK